MEVGVCAIMLENKKIDLQQLINLLVHDHLYHTLNVSVSKLMSTVYYSVFCAEPFFF